MNNFANKYGNGVTGPRGRWITLIVWIVLTASLSMLWPTVNSQENNSAANLPASYPSVQADEVAKREFPNAEGLPALIVWHRETGLTDDDLKAVQKFAETFTAKPLPEQTALPPYHQMPLPALKSQLSENKKTLVTPIVFANGAETDVLNENFDAIREQVKSQTGADPFAEKLASDR
ncbi:MAG: family transporter, partial [Paenibacillus sp.]|nr:family transporter [Paenibacillus sp.]